MCGGDKYLNPCRLHGRQAPIWNKRILYLPDRQLRRSSSSLFTRTRSVETAVSSAPRGKEKRKPWPSYPRASATRWCSSASAFSCLFLARRCSPLRAHRSTRPSSATTSSHPRTGTPDGARPMSCRKSWCFSRGQKGSLGRFQVSILPLSGSAIRLLADQRLLAILAIPYGLAANRFGRRNVLTLALVGLLLEESWNFVICKSGPPSGHDIIIC